MENIHLFVIFTIFTSKYHRIFVESKARFQIKASNIECFTDSLLIANKSCELLNIESTPTYNLEVYFKEGVEIKNLFLVFSWMYKTTNDVKYKPFLGLSNVTIDLCHYLTNGNSMLVDLFLDDVKKHSHLVHDCPFKGYCFIKDLPANMKKFPAIIPSGEYYMQMLFHKKLDGVQENLLKVKVAASVKTVNYG